MQNHLRNLRVVFQKLLQRYRHYIRPFTREHACQRQIRDFSPVFVIHDFQRCIAHGINRGLKDMNLSNWSVIRNQCKGKVLITAGCLALVIRSHGAQRCITPGSFGIVSDKNNIIGVL